MAKVYLFKDGIDENMKNRIADYFIAFANSTGDLVTNLKLQKLVYYAQAWHLALYGRALFAEEFQAWVHGPVLPSLYSRYREFQWNPIRRDDLDENAFDILKKELSPELNGFMEEIILEYFSLGAYELEQLTHLEDPWIKARKGCKPDDICRKDIAKVWMENYYK